MKRVCPSTKSKLAPYAIPFAFTLLLGLSIPVFQSLLPQVTATNYDRIRHSMSMQEVRQLLGRPDYDQTEYGIIGISGAYVTNDSLSDEEKIDLGYQKYRRLQWTSREITIVVVFDMNGLVATRYSGDGQNSAGWWRWWWAKRSVG